jgi:hypothetical protein
VLHSLPPANVAHLLSKSFFPNLIASPFMVGLHAVFYLSAFFCLVAAVASLLRGERYIHGQDQVAAGAVGVGSLPTSAAAESALQERSEGLARSPRSNERSNNNSLTRSSLNAQDTRANQK